MNSIIRKYNYKLETGTVGTDDENIANILFNINQMEKNASYVSSDIQELDNALGELFFMIVDAKVHLKRFLNTCENKTKTDTVDAVSVAVDNAMQIVGDARSDQTDTAKMSEALLKVYKGLLDIVPHILVLDAQAVGRV